MGDLVSGDNMEGNVIGMSYRVIMTHRFIRR